METYEMGRRTPAPRGHVLLLAGTPAGRRPRHLRAAENLHALAAVPVTALLRGSAPADLVQLADPAEPQSVLTRLRSAASTPGPLLVYVTGMLTADRRTGEPHLALARTTAHSVRYTAFPWTWLRDVLRGRQRPTAVLADLSADRSFWQSLLKQGPGQLTAGLPLYGVVTPPDTPSLDSGPAPYTRRLAEMLRTSPAPPDVATLHHLAVAHAALPGAALLLDDGGSWAGEETESHECGVVDTDAPTGSSSALPAPGSVRGAAHFPSPPAMPPPPLVASESSVDPHRVIRQAAGAGRHTEAAAMAAAWEQYALRAHGPGSAEVLHWLEVRADLARLAGDLGRACELWIAVARARLAAVGEAGPAVIAAVDNAHHCWERVPDRSAARALGPSLVALRREVPGPGKRSLRAAQRRLDRLHDDPPEELRPAPSSAHG